MAVYKPSNCVPFMDALDLTKSQDISCELNTSNMNVTGYKLKVLDSQNNIIFEGKDFTPLNDKSLRDYNNSGENGSILALPLIVDDINKMNENTLLLDKNAELYTRQNAKLSKAEAINGSYYYRWYIKVSYDELTRSVYDNISSGSVYKLKISYDVSEEETVYPQSNSSSLTYQSAIVNELYCWDYFTKIEPKPEYRVAYGRFYQLNEGKQELVTDEETYNSRTDVYARSYNYSQVAKQKESATGWDDSDNKYNQFYTIEQYRYIEGKIPSYDPIDANMYYAFYMKDNKFGLYSMKDIGSDDWSNVVSAYSRVGVPDYNYDVASNYFYYRLITDKETYKNADTVYIPKFSFVAEEETPFYYNSIYTLYKREYNFTSPFSTGASKPNYIEAVGAGVYYVDAEYGEPKLVTEVPFGYQQMIEDSGINGTKIGLYKYSNGKGALSKINSAGDLEVVDGFYNGALNQPYKWQIALAQGEYGIPSAQLGSRWYDMTVASGKVIGSIGSRIQGLYSNDIYRDYYIQLNTQPYDVKTISGNNVTTEVSNSMVGDRVRISSYDHTFGYVYPIDGGFLDDVIESGINGKIPNYFSIYKWPNNPEDVSAARKVDYATTRTLDTPIGSHTVSSKFALEATTGYYTQVYNGEVKAEDIVTGQYDTGSGNNPWVIGTTTLLVKDQEELQTQGVFVMVSIDYNSEGDRTIIKWQRTAQAKDLSDMLGRQYYIVNGSSRGLNYENDIEAGHGVIDSTPIVFFIEKPVEIYPDAADNDEYVQYYETNYRDIKYRKYFSPIFKTTENRILITPFVGINEDMRFYYHNNQEFFNIETVDKIIWGITPPNNKFTTDNKLNPGDAYVVTSYFKISDENSFYAYDSSYIDLIIRNSTGEFDSSGAAIIADRKLRVDAVYAQAQNISWKNYRWTLYNNTDGYMVAQTDNIYSGSFAHEFVGIENGSYYTVTLEIETESGEYLTMSKQVLSKVDIESKIDLSSEFDCQLQAVKFSFVRNGVIIPRPQISDTLIYGSGENPEESFVNISNTITDRNYGVVYDSFLSSVTTKENLQGPMENSITINSQHTLGEWFEGEVLDVIIDISEQDGHKMRQRITIDTGYDVRSIDGFLIENPNRNTMSVVAYKEAYEGGEIGRASCRERVCLYV